MKDLVASVLLFVSIFPAVALGQTKSKTVKQRSSQSGPRQSSTPVKICQGVAIPEGYVIVERQALERPECWQAL